MQLIFLSVSRPCALGRAWGAEVATGAVMISLKIKPNQANAYSPFGYLAGSSPLNILAYAGQVFDQYLSGYLLGQGYRCYAPSLMRFTSPDSISPFGEGGINAYSYCTGDPVNKVDPSGQMGQRTGLTGHLSRFGLTKRDLKAHLKPLAKAEYKGKSLQVIKVHSETFTTFEFTGNSPRIDAQVVAQSPLAELSGVYFKKDDTHIPATSRARGALTVKRFREGRDCATHPCFHQPSQAGAVSTAGERAVPNDYVEDIRR